LKYYFFIKVKEIGYTTNLFYFLVIYDLQGSQMFI